MKYRIISPRIGTPGALWEPEVFVNVHALLDGGFIERVTDETPDAPKLKKAKVAKSEKD